MHVVAVDERQLEVLSYSLAQCRLAWASTLSATALDQSWVDVVAHRPEPEVPMAMMSTLGALAPSVVIVVNARPQLVTFERQVHELATANRLLSSYSLTVISRKALRGSERTGPKHFVALTTSSLELPRPSCHLRRLLC